MKKTHCISLFFSVFCITCFCANDLYCQQKVKEERPFKERVSFGGALGFSFGSSSTLIDVSPIIGYAVSDNFIVGIGLTYKHYRYKNYYQNQVNGELSDYKTNMYGGSFWTRYFLKDIGIPIVENVFLHAEIEPLVFENSYSRASSSIGDYRDVYGNFFVKEKSRETLTGIFLGGGLRQPLGGRSYMYIEALWNFNEELFSPYSNPRIRIGVAAGF